MKFGIRALSAITAVVGFSLGRAFYMNVFETFIWLDYINGVYYCCVGMFSYLLAECIYMNQVRQKISQILDTAAQQKDDSRNNNDKNSA